MCPSVSKYPVNLAATTFFAKAHEGEMCGSNGLPLTPNSIAILGRAQRLKAIEHPNLCEYLDIIRGKHERTIVIAEHRGSSLDEKAHLIKDERTILRILYQIAVALNEIYEYDFVNHNLEPMHVLLDDLNNVKLFNYGLFYMTKSLEYVTFPIGNVHYMAPERILGVKDNIKSDVWSLGIIMSELLLDCKFFPSLKIANVARKILSFLHTPNVFEKIAREHDRLEKYNELNSDVRELVEKCLSVFLKDRLLPKDIIESPIFQTNIDLYQYKEPEKPAELLLRCPLKTIYYLWQLAGGDVQAELKKEGLIKWEAPILSMPLVVFLNGETIGPKKNRNRLFDNRIVILNVKNLLERLKKVPALSYFPLIHSPKIAVRYDTGAEELPLVIRERDIEYQFHRVMLFSRLLKGYPFTRDMIVKESQVDIPPLLRGKVWACLLDVIPDGRYFSIDKETPTPTDRQIEVDIPRCHQYDELLSSPKGHQKLKRLLKAWVSSHPQYVYWQGLDSLTAPFLYLNFNNEERAFLCLYKFIPKYLHWFFLKDNSAIIKEYLSKFSQLTAFHEPKLAKHLHNINFIPELFAIPWFLTMFSHVFPLHKIIHLWDKLMLGDNSYPLFIGIAVLKQLKTTLLESGFNECILLFSDLPDIVMETCVTDSQILYEKTPKSISWREHVVKEQEPGEFVKTSISNIPILLFLLLQDISNVTLKELQSERCPRISAKDLIELLSESPEKVAVIDIRGSIEYARARIDKSINIPFTSVSLGDTRLESLNISDLNTRIADRIVVIVSVVHENAVLFGAYLIDCGVVGVCILHKGFNVLHSFVPNILVTS